jgi:hypothetical protein
MNAAQQQYRSCFAAFVQELGALVDVAIREAIAAELDRLAVSENRKRRTVARAQSRRRAASAENGERPSRKPRGRAPRKSAPMEPSNGTEKPVQPAAAVPPPLFVHKRSRDGQIQHLSRRNGEDEAQPNTAAG